MPDEEPSKVAPVPASDPSSDDGGKPTPEQVLAYLQKGAPEEDKKIIASAFHAEWGGDPNSYNVRDLVIRQVHLLAGIRSERRRERALAAFGEELQGLLKDHEARVKEHAHAVTESTLASERVAGEIREELSKIERTLEEKTAVDAQSRVQALAALQAENRAIQAENLAMAQGIAKLQDMVAKVAMSSNIAMAAVMGVTVLVLVLGVLVVGHWFFIGV